MKAVVWLGPGRLEVAQRPVPLVRAGHSLVRVSFAGLCATDRELVAGAISDAITGVTPGHEIVGTVVDSMGPNAWIAGARVVVDTVFGCGDCERCLAGEFALCSVPQELGYTADGGWAEYVLVRNSHLYAIPDSLTLADAVLCEPFAMPFGSLLRSGETVLDRSVVVVGSGMAALGFAASAVVFGASEVVVSLRDSSRAATFEAIDVRVRVVTSGAAAPTSGTYDIAVDTVGSTESIRTAIAAVKPGGHVMAYGLRDSSVDFPLADVVMRNIRLAGYVNPSNVWPAVMARVGDGSLRLTGIVDRYISIDDAPDAVLNPADNLRTVIAFDPVPADADAPAGEAARG